MDHEYSFEKIHINYDGGNLNAESSFVTLSRCPVQIKGGYSYSKEKADVKFNEATTLLRDCSRELETAMAIIRDLKREINPIKQQNVGLKKKAQVYKQKLEHSKFEKKNLLRTERQKWAEEKAALYAEIIDLRQKNDDCNDTINEQRRNIQDNVEQSQKIQSLEAGNKMLQDKIDELREDNEGINLKLANLERKEAVMQKQIQELLFQLGLKDLRIVLKRTAIDAKPKASKLPTFENSDVGNRHVSDLRLAASSPDVDSSGNTEEPENVEVKLEPVRTSRRTAERLDYRTLAGYKTGKRTGNPQS